MKYENRKKCQISLLDILRADLMFTNSFFLYIVTSSTRGRTWLRWCQECLSG